MAQVKFLCLLLLLAVPSALACSIDPRPLFNLNVSASGEGCAFRSSEELAQGDMAEFIAQRQTQWSDCKLALSDDDNAALASIINQFNKDTIDFGTVFVRAFSPQEADDFSRMVDETNSDRCDCALYTNVTRAGRYTAYISTTDCGIDTACSPVPPRDCKEYEDYVWRSEFREGESGGWLLLSVVSLMFISLMFIVPLAVLIGIIVFLMLRKKRKGKK